MAGGICESISTCSSAVLLCFCRSVDKQPIKRYRRDSLSSKSSDSETEERSRYRRSKNTSSHNKNK